MEQAMMVWDVALWCLPSSAWPDIAACLAVDEYTLPFEVVQALMQAHKETYVYKAAVGMSDRIERYWHIKLPRQIETPIERVSVNEVVKQLWQLLEADGIDPVEVSSRDALSLARASVTDEPENIFARWFPMAMASDERAFTDRWNDWRSAVVRARLAQEEERVVV